MSNQAIDVPAGLTTEGLLGRRYIARLVDSVVISAMMIPALWTSGVLRIELNSGTLSALRNFCFSLILWIGYGAMFESSSWQATVGKRLMGLRVYNSEARRVEPLRAVVRNLVKDGPFVALAFLPSVSFLSFFWLAAHLFVIHRSPVNQAIHDRLVQTWVAAPEQTIQLHLR